VNLVASSITGLSPEQVTVVDQQGQQLSSQDDNDDLGLSSRQFTYRQRIEEAYQRNIEELLGPLADAGQVRVKVAANIDFSSAEQSRESWSPESKVVRSEQINERMNADVNANASGMPGALSNQPPTGGVENNKAAEDKGNRSIVRNYEIERILNHSSTPTGMVRRLSVAVVVANRQSTDAEGQSILVEVPPLELEKMNLLVRDAIGFDADRGDRVTVVSADFKPLENIEMETVTPGFWEQPWFANLVKQSLVGIGVLFIIFAILRPGMRTLMSAQINAAQAAPQALTDGGEKGVSGEVLHPAVAALAALGGPGRMGFEDKMTEARSVVDENPQRVAQVMKKWVAEENGKS
jgi:flagellar M-ring protein FliF